MVVAGSLLGNSFIAGRMTVAAANKNWFPRTFGNLGYIGILQKQDMEDEDTEQSNEPKKGSDAPLNALILSTFLSSLYIIFGNFRALLVFNGLGEYAFFFLTTVGAIALRFTQPHLERPYKTLLVVPLIFALVSGFVVVRGASFQPKIALVLIVLWLIGYGFYLMRRR